MSDFRSDVRAQISLGEEACLRGGSVLYGVFFVLAGFRVDRREVVKAAAVEAAVAAAVASAVTAVVEAAAATVAGAVAAAALA